MRRGLLKDLANTPTQIACGWRLYGDLPRLTVLSGSEVVVDLLPGTAMVDGGDALDVLGDNPLAVGMARRHAEQAGKSL
jgi:hypothetical protein